MIRIKDMAGTGQDLKCRRVVIKLGSGVVMNESGSVDLATIRAIAGAIVRLRENQVDVILVTSGAIAVGRGLLNRPEPKTIPEKQALAAAGQISLMKTYERIFSRRGMRTAQILLTQDDMEDRRRYLNIRDTLERLLQFDVVPIINENDTTSTDEITFGDNDLLSAFVAVKMKADLLVLLSVVDGVYRPAGATDDPTKRVLAPVISGIDPKVYGWVQRGASEFGKGGMKSKLDAASLAARAGVAAVLAHGKKPGILDRIFTGSFRGTFFPAAKSGAMPARARWIGFSRTSKGRRLVIDQGAVEAIVRKKTSLLPVGVVKVEGEFRRGDVIEICSPNGETLARGLTNYSSDEVDRIKGHRTSRIQSILGDRKYDEIVHRNNMIILDRI